MSFPLRGERPLSLPLLPPLSSPLPPVLESRGSRALLRSERAAGAWRWRLQVAAGESGGNEIPNATLWKMNSFGGGGLLVWQPHSNVPLRVQFNVRNEFADLIKLVTY